MPRGDRTGPNGTLINCTDPETGIRRPIANTRYVGARGNYNPRFNPRNTQGINPDNPNIRGRTPVARGMGRGQGRRGRGFHRGRK